MGTNRIVVVLKSKVIKIPKHLRGVEANRLEYSNYSKAPAGMVATTSMHSIFLVQERLQDVEIYVKSASREQVPLYARKLYDIKLHNRLQIGRSLSGEWKIFDYEDVKFYSEESNALIKKIVGMK